MGNAKKIELILTSESLYYDQELPRTQASLWSKELEDLEPFEVVEALRFFRADVSRKKVPMPSEIRRRVYNFEDGDVSWANILKGDHETIVWSEESRLAYGEASSLLQLGDKIGARIAYLKAYEKRLSESLFNKVRPKWSISHATLKDPIQEEFALRQAALENKIKPLPCLEYEQKEDVEFNKEKFQELLRYIEKRASSKKEQDALKKEERIKRRESEMRAALEGLMYLKELNGPGS